MKVSLFLGSGHVVSRDSMVLPFFQEDEDLLHLAREGLKAPLGEGWKPCTNENEEAGPPLFG